MIREKNRTQVLVLSWEDHPEKTIEWYKRERQQKLDDGLLHVFRQEVERDYAGAVEGVIIDPIWVNSAIDAHIHLKFDPTGGRIAALDISDEGGDLNALAMRKGVLLESLDEWGDVDTGVTARRAIKFCIDLLGRDYETIDLMYDSVGMGASFKAEANRLRAENLLPKTIRVVPWNAGASTLWPDKNVVEHDRKSPINKDFFHNLKAQAWWAVARMFEKTHRARTEPKFTWEPDELISLSSKIPLLRKLQKELSQPTIIQSSTLKLMIDKKPEGARSPNMADAVIMCFFPIKSQQLNISPEIMAKSRLPYGGRLGNVFRQRRRF